MNKPSFNFAVDLHRSAMSSITSASDYFQIYHNLVSQLPYSAIDKVAEDFLIVITKDAAFFCSATEAARP